MTLQQDIDLLNPPVTLEAKRHKRKRLVQSPNSYFMDVKCQGCFNITTVFSHSQTVVTCSSCAAVLAQPTGGKARCDLCGDVFCWSVPITCLYTLS